MCAHRNMCKIACIAIFGQFLVNFGNFLLFTWNTQNGIRICVAESISIKFEYVDFWLKFMKTARGTPWKTFFAQEMKWLEIYRNDSIWPWQTDPRILRLSNKYFSFYEFSKSEIILVNLARNMIFRVENWKIAGEKAFHNSLDDS